MYQKQGLPSLNSGQLVVAATAAYFQSIWPGFTWTDDSCSTLLLLPHQQADVFRAEGNQLQLYVFLLRFIRSVIAGQEGVVLLMILVAWKPHQECCLTVVHSNSAYCTGALMMRLRELKCTHLIVVRMTRSWNLEA